MVVGEQVNSKHVRWLQALQDRVEAMVAEQLRVAGTAAVLAPSQPFPEVCAAVSLVKALSEVGGGPSPAFLPHLVAFLARVAQDNSGNAGLLLAAKTPVMQRQPKCAVFAPPFSHLICNPLSWHLPSGCRTWHLEASKSARTLDLSDILHLVCCFGLLSGLAPGVDGCLTCGDWSREAAPAEPDYGTIPWALCEIIPLTRGHVTTLGEAHKQTYLRVSI